MNQVTEALKDPRFLSIERFVAFILGPIVIALSGSLSVWLAKEAGVHISAHELVGIFATGGLAAGALVWKWLDGRAKSTSTKTVAILEAALKTDDPLRTLLGRERPAATVAAKAPPPIPPAAHDPAPSGQSLDAEAATAGVASTQ